MGRRSPPLIWATYAAGLGAIFGKRVQDNHTVAFLLAFGAALSVTIIIEVVRHVRGKRTEDAEAPAPVDVS